MSKYAIPRIKKGYEYLLVENKVDTNGFTIGKRYKIVCNEFNGYIVLNDNGHQRFIMADGCISGHIVTKPTGQPMTSSFRDQIPVGYFEIVEAC